jgi:hypothetical protein
VVAVGGNVFGHAGEAVKCLANTLRTQAESVRSIQDSVELVDR